MHNTAIEIINTEEGYNTEPLSFTLKIYPFVAKTLATSILKMNRNMKNQEKMCDDIRVYPDDVIVREFSLSVDGICYKSAEKTLWFEAELEDICRKINSDYYIKYCFTCQYSDYSPYGSDDYGLMLCFCRHKNDCLKVNSKDDFFSFLEGNDYDGRQETYLCEHYCM